MTCDIPSGTKNQEVGKRNSRLFRFSGQNAKYGWVNVVFGDAADIDEFLHGIFIWHIAMVMY
jgi:hypothetical protein